MTHFFLIPSSSHRYAPFSAFIFRSDLHHLGGLLSALSSIIKHHRHQQWLRNVRYFPYWCCLSQLAPSFLQCTALTVGREESSSLSGTSLLGERMHEIALLLGLVCFSGISDLRYIPLRCPPYCLLCNLILGRFWCSVTYNTHNDIGIICRPKPQQAISWCLLEIASSLPTAFLLTPECQVIMFSTSSVSNRLMLPCSQQWNVSDKDWTHKRQVRVSCLLTQFPQYFQKWSPTRLDCYSKKKLPLRLFEGLHLRLISIKQLSLILLNTL